MEARSFVKLDPALPPGRGDRKALAFRAEIHRLRKAGYSFGAIRTALAAAGVHVSRSTVHREASRDDKSTPARVVSQREAARPVQDSAFPITSQLRATDTRSSKEIARQFFEGRITNPLILARGQR
jgi:IS30 family transposase